MRWKIVCRGLVDLVVVRCGDQSFELDLDVEVSVERKAHCVGQVGEERQCVLDWNVGGCVGCCALHELTSRALMCLKWMWLRVLLQMLNFFEHRVGDGVLRSCLLMMCVCF